MTISRRNSGASAAGADGGHPWWAMSSPLGAWGGVIASISGAQRISSILRALGP